MRKKWFYNEKTKSETHCLEMPNGEGWKVGRLPFSLWSDERKKSYREKRSLIVYSDEYKDEQRKRSKKFQTDKVGYTDGKRNIWLRIGQDVPYGFYKGWTITEPFKYWRMEKKIEWLKQLMEGQQ
jgi:hypothetical protein